MTWVYILVCAFYSAFWSLARPLGVLPLLFIVVLAVFCNIETRGRYLVSGPSAVAGIGLIWAALSYQRIFEHAWTRFYDPDAILQQAFGYISMPLFIGAGATATAVIYKGWQRHKNRILICGFVLFGIVAAAVQAYADGDLEQSSYIPVLIGTFSNAHIMLAVCVAYVILKLPVGRSLLVCFLVIVFAGNLQSRIAFMVLAVFRMDIAPARVIALAVCLTFVGVEVVSLWFTPELMSIDPDTGIRTQFWNDALEAVRQSYGLGIGFGTESIQGEYSFAAGLQSVINPNIEGAFLFIGVHNSLINIALRCGWFGFAAMAYTFYQAFPPTQVRGTLPYWAYFVVLVTTITNVGIESVNFSIGVCSVLGALTFFRFRAQERNSIDARDQTRSSMLLRKQLSLQKQPSYPIPGVETRNE